MPSFAAIYNGQIWGYGSSYDDATNHAMATYQNYFPSDEPDELMFMVYEVSDVLNYLLTTQPDCRSISFVLHGMELLHHDFKLNRVY